MATVPTLKLVREEKLRALMPKDAPGKRWEASGVLVQEGEFFVVCDDRTAIARIADDLRPNSKNGLFGVAHAVCGYEGIAYNAAQKRYYLLVEARKHAGGVYQALIVEYDGDFDYRKQRPLDFDFESSNKGFEAVAYVERDGQDFLLALCEGNKCCCGKKGREPGGGRIQLFEKSKKRWRHRDTIALPPSVPFVDYSGMSIDRGRVAVVSQVNSMLWVGKFNEAEWSWHDAGQLYDFPRADNGAIQYGNIEGVGWMSPSRVVTVSDRRKKSSQPDESLAEKDQSIHIFEIPN
jgi:hypothetical protein